MIYKPNYIFIHVPKTGGMSVSNALGGKDKKNSTHTPLRCVPKENRFAFGFMRNPWARMVSLYRFLCQKNFRRTDNFDQEAVRQMGFKKWLMDDEFIMTEDDHPQGEPWVMKDHWRTEPPVEEGYGTRAPRPKAVAAMQRRPQMWWLEGCDFIGFTENMPDDFYMACELGGITRHKELPHINRTKGGNWRNEYDDQTIEFVAKHFAPDIEVGGYTFD